MGFVISLLSSVSCSYGLVSESKLEGNMSKWEELYS